MVEQTLFSAVSAVTQHESGRFSAEIDPEWTIGAKPNGGYLLSMLARAATTTRVHDHVIAGGARYLHRRRTSGRVLRLGHVGSTGGPRDPARRYPPRLTPRMSFWHIGLAHSGHPPLKA